MNKYQRFAKEFESDLPKIAEEMLNAANNGKYYVTAECDNNILAYHILEERLLKLGYKLDLYSMDFRIKWHQCTSGPHDRLFPSSDKLFMIAESAGNKIESIIKARGKIINQLIVNETATVEIDFSYVNDLLEMFDDIEVLKIEGKSLTVKVVDK